MSNFPGAFPSTPSSNNVNYQDRSSIIDFSFAPRAQPLYPNIDHLKDAVNPSMRLDQECERLGFSKKLSTNVLKELDERAARFSVPNNIPKRSVLSPRSSRYNSSHRSRFAKMESISSHYAASRTDADHRGHSGEIEIDKENIPSYDPHSKRSNTSIMSNIAKRRKTESKTSESHSRLLQSRGSNDLHNMLRTGSRKLDSRIPRSPSKSSLQPPVKLEASSNNLMSHMSTKSSTSLKKSSIPTSKTIHSNISKLTAAKKLPRSATLNNLTKPTASSISKSTSYRSLEPNRMDHSVTGNSSLSKSKSIHNLKANSQNKPVWR